MNYKKNRKIFLITLVGILCSLCWYIFLTPSAFETRKNVKNVKGVSLGMAKNDVIDIMGAPDDRRLSFLKTTDSMYYYKPPFGASEGIYIQFDKNNTVNEIVDLQYFLNVKHPKRQLPFFNYPGKDTISWRTAINWKMEKAAPSNRITTANYPHLNLDSLFKTSWAKENLVFLKPNEVKKEKVSLIGFALLGGNYTFYIDKKPLPDHLLTDPIWSKEDRRTELRKICFPQRIGNYQLYTGDFLTNNVSIQFIALGDPSTLMLGFLEEK